MIPAPTYNCEVLPESTCRVARESMITEGIGGYIAAVGTERPFSLCDSRIVSSCRGRGMGSIYMASTSSSSWGD